MNQDFKQQPNGFRPSQPAGQQQQSSGVVGHAKEAATELAGEAKDKLGHEIDAQKERALGSIGGVAEALRETGRSMRTRDGAVPAEYADRLADQIERFTGYVQSRTVGDLIGDVERFARREPAIFIGGAFAVGLIAGRFLKSSGRPVGGMPSSSGREPRSENASRPVPPRPTPKSTPDGGGGMGGL